MNTERLVQLDPIAPSHAEAMYEGLRDPALYEFLPHSPPASVEALRERYERQSKGRSPDGAETWLNWALWSHAQGAYVGYVQATLTAGLHAEVGYVLFRSAWGRGYARDGVAQMLARLHGEHAVREVGATVDPRNVRSCALLESLGFVRTELRYEAEWQHGVLADEAVYALRGPPGA